MRHRKKNAELFRSKQLISMSIQHKLSHTKRNTVECNKRRLPYNHRSRRDNHKKRRSPLNMKNADSIPEVAAFPRIVWNDDTDDGSLLDDYSSSSSSADDYLLKKLCSIERAEWWFNDSFNRPEGMSLDHHHLHRTMAFFDLDSLGSSLSASKPER
jgi:hypothetical protein